MVITEKNAQQLKTCLEFGRSLKTEDAYAKRGEITKIIDKEMEETYPLAQMPDDRQDETELFTWLKMRNKLYVGLWDAFAAGLTGRAIETKYEVMRGPYATLDETIDVRAGMTPKEHEYRATLIVRGYDGYWYIAR